MTRDSAGHFGEEGDYYSELVDCVHNDPNLYHIQVMSHTVTPLTTKQNVVLRDSQLFDLSIFIMTIARLCLHVHFLFS